MILQVVEETRGKHGELRQALKFHSKTQATPWVHQKEQRAEQVILRIG